MSGTVNPAFESNELSMLEAGHLADEPMEGGKEASKEESTSCLQAGYNAIDRFLSKHHRTFKFLLLTTLNLAVLLYFVFATLYWRNHNYESFDWCNGYGLLILLLVFIYGRILYYAASKCFPGKILHSCALPLRDCTRSIRNTKYGFALRAVIYTCVLLAIIVFLIIDTADSRERLMSGIGVIALMSFGWVFSKYPSRIDWRPVLTGLILQFLLGLLTMRWPVGRAIFQCFAGKIESFLNFAKDGASFIFSEELVNKGVFAFAVLPVIFYFSFFIQILYYLGVMQTIILNLGKVLHKIMGTSICESVTCAANIFVGMSESPLVIKPYLNKLTASELHTIMCSGFATVSGTVFAAYISFGANPAHLITASLMAAPAALCYSKLFYPETEKSKVTSETIRLEKSQDSSLMDAASKGAVAAIPLVLGIIANIIAFVSFVALVNFLLSWLGSLVGYKELSFEFILSKVFIPLSWIMGVPWDKCEDVATLIGLKTVVNEFVAYQKLGEFKEQGRIFGRTEAIATFAICGFANPGSLGITISVLPSLAPDKKESITGALMRSFLAGCAVCFLTASIAGMLISDEYYLPANVTMATNIIAS